MLDDIKRALLGDKEAAKRLTDAGVLLMRGDCLELLKDIPDGSVDMVLTDPPYSSGGMYRSDRASGSSKKYQSTDTKDIKHDFAGDNRDQRSFTLWETFWVSAAKRKMRPGGIAVIFTDWRQLAATIDAVQCGGLVYRGVVPWIKTAARPQKGRFTQNAEYCVWASNGHIPNEGGNYKGYFVGNPPATSKRVHATEKPIELLEHLMSISPDGGTVMDMFMGSGSTGVACINTGRKFIGMELDPGYFEAAKRRIEEAQAQARLAWNTRAPEGKGTAVSTQRKVSKQIPGGAE